MKNRRIDNLKTVCMTENTTNLKYAINMEYLLNYTYTQITETLFWEYYQRADAFYHFLTSNTHELQYDAVTRKVSKIYDQSLSQSDAYQNTTTNQPTICGKNDRINNKRYYLEFNGSQRMISDIDLNPANGEEDIINLFIVYNISSFSGTYWCRCGIAGHDDGLFDRFLAFSPQGDLIVSGTTNDHIVIGLNATNGKSVIAGYKTKANPGILNKWVCLSVQWNIPSETSYVYCNGKKLTDFTARTSVGSLQMTFGDLNPSGIAPFYGKISCFLLYKNKRMTTRDIMLHHSVLCKWYGVDHDPITF